MQKQHKAFNGLVGFTIIEMIITIILISIISVILAKVLISSYTSFQTANSINEAEMQNLLAIQRLSADLYTLRSAADITAASASSLSFNDGNGTAISYALSGSNLQRSGITLASGIAALNLSYLDKSLAVTALPQQIRYVGISLTGFSGTITTTLTTTIGFRTNNK